MKVVSPIFNEISGKLGGAVGMTSRFGMFLRGLVTPNNPNTGPQFIVRGILATLGAYWDSTLTAVQRGTWSSLSEDTPGSSDGKGMFVKANALRLRVDDAVNPIVLTAPASLNAVFNDIPTALTLETVGVVGTTRTLTYTLPADADLTDSWALVDGGFLAIYVSRPQRATRLTKIKPYVFVGHVNGDTTLASRPGGVNTVSLAATLFEEAFAGADVGDVSYVQFQASDSFGRITAKYTVRVVWEAP